MTIPNNINTHDSLNLYQNNFGDLDSTIIETRPLTPGHMAVAAGHPSVQRSHEHYQSDEDDLHKFNDDVSPDWLLNDEDEIEDILHPINKPFEGMEDSLETDLNAGFDDIYGD
jgi:hypothetical protein